MVHLPQRHKPHLSLIALRQAPGGMDPDGRSQLMMRASDGLTTRTRRLGILVIALVLVVGFPLAASAGYQEGYINCQISYSPRTYSTTNGNWDHSHWMEGHGSYFAPGAAGVWKKWTGAPNYGSWSVWSEAALTSGGAQCIL